MSDAPAIDGADDPNPVRQGLERYRAVRRELESSVLPLASSLDGRRFEFQASLHGLEVRLGGYVVVEHDGASRLGQVLALEPALGDGAELDLPGGTDGETAMRSRVPIRYARGEGALLEGDGAPFHDATVRPATPGEVRDWTLRTRSRRAQLEIGELAPSPGVAAGLDAGGFDRHTFLCGQSGSGKTYSLGVVLEELLARTGLRIVVLDPNSDFVRLGTVRDGADPAAAERYREAARTISVHSSRAEGPQRLRIRLSEIEPAARAALLRLDPIADREEHAELADLLAEGRAHTVAGMLESPRPEGRRLALRAQQPRPRAVRRLGPRRGRLDARRDPRSRRALRRGRPRLARDARGAGADGRGGARRALAPARAAQPGADRHRRGPQRVPRGRRRTR